MRLILTPDSANHAGYIDTETECGKVYIRRFRADYPSGRPYHLIGMGTFHASPEAALEWLQTPGNPRRPDAHGFFSGYGFNTHAPAGN